MDEGIRQDAQHAMFVEAPGHGEGNDGDHPAMGDQIGRREEERSFHQAGRQDCVTADEFLLDHLPADQKLMQEAKVFQRQTSCELNVKAREELIKAGMQITASLTPNASVCVKNSSPSR